MEKYPIIGDGATGTNLLPYSALPDSLNLSRPDIVARLHADYLLAGSRLLRTNTFLLPETAAEGARIALQAAGGNAKVIGCIGPKKEADDAQTIEAYRRHIQALRQAGITHLRLETMHSPHTLRLALKAASEFSIPELSVSAYLNPNFTPGELLQICRDFAVNRIGLNCMPPDDSLRLALEALLASADPLIISAYPEAAGLNPEQWAERVTTLLSDLPIAEAGGCCGTTPAHIRELARRKIQ